MSISLDCGLYREQADRSEHEWCRHETDIDCHRFFRKIESTHVMAQDNAPWSATYSPTSISIIGRLAFFELIDMVLLCAERPSQACESWSKIDDRTFRRLPGGVISDVRLKFGAIFVTGSVHLSFAVEL
jgi:hypothetical protein